MKKEKKGFTLVELLVVIAILAILASVTVVGYLGFTKKANESKAQTELTQIRDVINNSIISNDSSAKVYADHTKNVIYVKAATEADAITVLTNLDADDLGSLISSDNFDLFYNNNTDINVNEGGWIIFNSASYTTRDATAVWDVATGEVK